MWFFRRIDLFDLFQGYRFVSFVGGGGKTSLAEWVAAAGTRRGKTVLITTTTKIYAKGPYILMENYRPGSARERGLPLWVGKTVEGRKLTGLSEEEVLRLGVEADLVLIEADGAKRMPLKAPAPYEPVIPACSDVVVVVAGLDALGARISEKVFRRDLWCKATGMEGDPLITPDVFSRFFSDDLLMKGVDRSRCLIALNKYDRAGTRNGVLEFGRQIAERAGAPRVLITSPRLGVFYSIERVL